MHPFHTFPTYFLKNNFLQGKKIVLLNQWIGETVVPRAGLDAVAKR
jgi:hypothetical protein